MSAAGSRAAAEAWRRAGLEAHDIGNHALAAELLAKAVALDPSVPGWHSDLGQIFRAAGDPAAARRSLERALALDPAHAKALANLAGLARSEGNFGAALDLARRAAGAAPGDPETHNNLGNALRDNGLLLEAVSAFDRALSLDPDFALAHWNRSLALLASGDLAAGFAEMRWRWRWDQFPGRRRSLAAPLWDGRDLGGGTLLLHAEQGLGDAIQFARYARLAAPRAGTLILELPRALVPLAAEAGLAGAVVAAGDPLPPFDAHAPLLDLPAIFATTLPTIPLDLPYLAVPGRERAAAHGDLRSLRGLKVGLNWRGNPGSPIERFRALPPAALAPWGGIAGVSWVTLDADPADRAALPPLPLADVGASPLVRAAALIAGLDLVVTSDTAIAHLAGALARPALLALHHAPDWRWMADRTDSPWYPSIRLFRQSAPGDWTPVIAEIALELRRRVGALRARARRYK